ncbi:hypothetical protein ACFV6F_29895 [Kitasatospora phosalacinea]|uniref:hypothetical protein n=1 Tax=Kitasatospora phosalacinea TaxID=2065 RepID=UPI00365CE608
MGDQGAEQPGPPDVVRVLGQARAPLGVVEAAAGQAAPVAGEHRAGVCQVRDALAAALGPDPAPERLAEVTAALDVLARHLLPRD